MYQTKTMEKLEMMECPQCGGPMPVKKIEIIYKAHLR
jgi:ssDNA-binding Zn-finger/Zn-ribbon topoisomerase 1